MESWVWPVLAPIPGLGLSPLRLSGGEGCRQLVSELRHSCQAPRLAQPRTCGNKGRCRWMDSRTGLDSMGGADIQAGGCRGAGRGGCLSSTPLQQTPDKKKRKASRVVPRSWAILQLPRAQQRERRGEKTDGSAHCSLSGYRRELGADFRGS